MMAGGRWFSGQGGGPSPLLPPGHFCRRGRAGQFFRGEGGHLSSRKSKDSKKGTPSQGDCTGDLGSHDGFLEGDSTTFQEKT